MAKINTTIRRWCETCQAFTKSRMDGYGDEVCVEHVEPRGDDEW